MAGQHLEGQECREGRNANGLPRRPGANGDIMRYRDGRKRKSFHSDGCVLGEPLQYDYEPNDCLHARAPRGDYRVQCMAKAMGTRGRGGPDLL